MVLYCLNYCVKQIVLKVTTTYIFDIRDLDNVDYRRAHFSEIVAVDHNQYIVDNGHYYSSNDDAFRGYTFQVFVFFDILYIVF